MQIQHMVPLFRVHWQDISGSAELWETRVASNDSKGDVRESRDCQFSFTQTEENRTDRKTEEFVYTRGGH